ncbi:MAG: PfkB family carbohydrate kinase [Candidatus Promineifilaceae bacterium]|nr:PfkB family carbohydrate kinase [Candidatus Promineifilaceae bacterium]
MLDVLASGYPSLDHIIPVSNSPGEGESATIYELPSLVRATDGGCGPNVAVGLARMGLKAGVATIIGDDEAGVLYRSRLAAQGVDIADVITVPGTQTSRAFMFRNPEGEYQIFFFAGAADAWAGQLTLNNLNHLRYGLLTVAPATYNRQFVELLRPMGIPLLWQLKSTIVSFPPQAVAYFAQASRVILMNHVEAVYIKEALDLDHIEELINEETQVLILTLGKWGSRVITADARHNIEAVPTEVVDTTGAGDAFTAGFLAGMLKGYDLPISARIGSVVASFVLEVVGCQINLPLWETMRRRYLSHYGEL